MTSTTILSDNGVLSGTSGYKLDGGNDGKLVLQTTTSGGVATSAVTIDTSQNVGIGTTSPTLDVGSGLSVVRSGGSSTIQASRSDASIVGSVSLVGGSLTNSIYSVGAKPLNFFTDSTERMRIDSSGNVGIGTTYGGGRLNVTTGSQGGDGAYATYKGTIVINEAGASSLQTTGGLEFKASVFGSGYGAKLQSADNGSLMFGYRNNSATWSESMRIDSSGNLLVGRTSALSQIAATGAPLISSTSGGGYSNYNGASQVLFGGSNGNEGCWFTSGAFRVMNASQNGVYISNGATSWSGSSDERLKTALKPFENAAQKVCTLRAGTGRYLTDDENVSRSFLIAQDVQKVLPEAVNIQDDEQGTLGLQYTDLIPLLTAAIQEQQAIIEQLRADVALLKARA